VKREGFRYYIAGGSQILDIVRYSFLAIHRKNIYKYPQNLLANLQVPALYQWKTHPGWSAILFLKKILTHFCGKVLLYRMLG
jgi:hypothetical protein